MIKKERFLFFDEAKRKRIKDFINKEFYEVFTYACTFSVKYLNISGLVKKKGTITTNQEIDSVEDRKIVEDGYVEKHDDIETAKVIQIFEVSHKKVIVEETDIDI